MTESRMQGYQVDEEEIVPIAEETKVYPFDMEAPEFGHQFRYTNQRGINHVAAASAAVEDRLIHPPEPRPFSVAGAISSAFSLFIKHPFAYITWYLLMLVITAAVNVAMIVIWQNDPGQSSLWLEYIVMELPALLYFPLMYGPFVTASNCLRTGGSGFEWRDLFATGYKYYFPLFILSIVQAFIYIAAYLAVAVPLGFLFKSIDMNPFVAAHLMVVPGVLFVLFFVVKFSFSSGVYIEYHEDISLLQSMRVSYYGTRATFWRILALMLACTALMLVPGVLFAVGFVLQGPLLGAGLAAVAGVPIFPIVSLAWADAFNQAIGFNDGFNGRPVGCVCW